MLKLVIIFTIIPLIELSLLIKLSHYLGILFTILLVAFTGLLGAYLTKKQGTDVLNKIRTSISQGFMPADSLIDGLLIFIGGVLLITPGLLTDLAGFACIVPLSRKKIKYLAKDRLSRLIKTGNFSFKTTDDDEKNIRVIKREDS